MMTAPGPYGLTAVLFLTATGVLPAAAQSAGTFADADRIAAQLEPTMAARQDCEAISAWRIDGVSVIRGRTMPAADGLPSFCRVTGVISPEIQFEIALPERWNKRLYMFGNGGFAGENLAAPARVANRDRALARGFLTVQQNTGHDAATTPLGTFARGNLQRLIDYGERGVHATVVLAKELASRYYSKSPAYSYWDGCSTGGRQGFVAAERYPADFDGILAGAPVHDFKNSQLLHVWKAQAVAEAGLTEAHQTLLGKAVLEHCDKTDGVEDGLVADPRQCAFDPEAHLPMCSGAAGADCFTPAQVAAIKKAMGGIRVGGKQMTPPLPWGAEIADTAGKSGWSGWIGADGKPGFIVQYGETYLRNMTPLGARKPDLGWRDFDFETQFADADPVSETLAPTGADLSAFAAMGGRIISYFGWADPGLNPNMGIAHYEALREEMGAETGDDFFRLFMMPGMFHCRAGYGPDQLDAMTPLIEWVEQGKAPETIVARQKQGADVVRTLPLCSFPQVARYGGAGDVKDAASFSCQAPQ